MIDLLTNETVTIRRYGAGSYSDGYYTRPPATTVSIRAAIQPLDGRELLQLPEGDRLKDHRVIFSRSYIQPGDIVEYMDTLYEIVEVEDWSRYCIFHYRAIMRRLDIQDEQL